LILFFNLSICRSFAFSPSDFSHTAVAIAQTFGGAISREPSTLGVAGAPPTISQSEHRERLDYSKRRAITDHFMEADAEM
jgi:hypothetical protein